MDEVIVDWSRTKTELEKLCLLFVCEKCQNPLQEPCSFEMCDHYFCKQCALKLINCGNNCPTCNAVLWREHLQPNLRISEAMNICKQIVDLVRTDSNLDGEEGVYCDSVVKQNILEDNGYNESDSEDDSHYIMNLGDNMESDDDASDVDNKETIESDDGVNEESDDGEKMDVAQLSALAKPGGSLIALGKGVSSNVKKLKMFETEYIDFDIDEDDSVIAIDEIKEEKILTAIKSKKKNTSEMPISIPSTPSPPKSQFSEAVSDEQFAQGVQRNPKCMTKKPKVTYGGKKRGGGKTSSADSALLVSSRSLKNSEEEQCIFDFSSGTNTKPISFNKNDDKENKSEDVGRENANLNISTNSKDPFIFSSGTITKPINLSRVNKNPTKSNNKDDMNKDNVDMKSNSENKNVKTSKKRTNRKKKGRQEQVEEEFDPVTLEFNEVAPKPKRVSFETHVILKDERKSSEISNTKAKITKINQPANDSTKSDKCTERQADKVPKPKVRNLEKKNKNGETPLHTACIKGKYEQAKELLKLGAQANTKDFNGWTPLHEASNHGFADIVALLLDYNGIIDCVAGEDNDTPLHDAVSNNRIDVVKVLLQLGAPTNIKNRIGLYPEGCAVTSEMKAVFKELNMFKNINLTDNQLDTSIASTSIIIGPFVIATTNLKAQENVEIQKCCDCFGGKVVSAFKNDVTHIVCGTDKNMISSSRTMKYLLGVLTGKWLVSYKWITDCLKENKWLPESSYEVKGAPGACEDVPQKSRLNNFKCLPKLFDGCSFYLSGVYSKHLPKEKVMNLVTLGGGKVLYREPKTSDIDPLIAPLPHEMNKLKLGVKVQHPDVIFHAKENSAQVCCKEYIIYDDQENPSHKTIFSPVLCTAPVAWLLDCISNFQILDIRDVYDVDEAVKSSQN